MAKSNGEVFFFEGSSLEGECRPAQDNYQPKITKANCKLTLAGLF